MKSQIEIAADEFERATADALNRMDMSALLIRLEMAAMRIEAIAKWMQHESADAETLAAIDDSYNDRVESVPSVDALFDEEDK